MKFHETTAANSVVMAVLTSAALSTAAPAEKKLAIVKLAFAQSEDGPALASTYQFLAGESVFFSCLVEGYTKSDKDEIS